MRAFLAFDVSPEVRDSLVVAEEELRATRADVKIVERENLHFTVKFLGEVPETAVREVDARLRGVSLSRMDVGVRGLGAFPDARRPRVVWAGVATEDLAPIRRAGELVIGALEGIGQSEERAFHPHITLARVRSPRNNEALLAVLRTQAGKDFGRTPITALKLKASTLTPKGPTYRDVMEYALQ